MKMCNLIVLHLWCAWAAPQVLHLWCGHHHKSCTSGVGDTTSVALMVWEAPQVLHLWCERHHKCCTSDVGGTTSAAPLVWSTPQVLHLWVGRHHKCCTPGVGGTTSAAPLVWEAPQVLHSDQSTNSASSNKFFSPTADGASFSELFHCWHFTEVFNMTTFSMVPSNLFICHATVT